MKKQLESITNLYKLNTGLYLRALDMAQESDILERPLQKANSFHWVAGHLTASRFLVAQLLGIEAKFPKSKLFEYGAEPQDPSEYPGIDEIKSGWNEITERMIDSLEEIPDEDLASEPQFHYPGVEKTVGAMVAFMQHHETYHMGQLAYINRLHGKDKLVG